MIRISNRRNVLLGLAAFAASPAAAFGQQRTLYDMSFDEDESGYDAALLPPPESPVDFPIEPVDMDDIPDRYHSQIVEYGGIDDPGTLVVDPANRFLYKVLGRGEALRYGVGVGRAGFAWAGEAEIAMKRRWPRWVPPREMVARDAKAAKWANGQPGGPDNPLGARALYLYANGVDTLYRIHGTNEPKSIGKAMSSGCIRMLNQDIAELYLEVPLKTRVVVLQSDGA